jgi:hypothetical protein
VFSIEGRGRDLFDAAERLDLEGIVAKRKTDPYRPETVWYKIKSRTCPDTSDGLSCDSLCDSDFRQNKAPQHYSLRGFALKYRGARI